MRHVNYSLYSTRAVSEKVLRKMLLDKKEDRTL